MRFQDTSNGRSKLTLSADWIMALSLAGVVGMTWLLAFCVYGLLRWAT